VSESPAGREPQLRLVDGSLVWTWITSSDRTIPLIAGGAPDEEESAPPDPASGGEETSATPPVEEGDPSEGEPPKPDPESEGQQTFDRQYVQTLRGEAADWRTKFRDEAKQREEMAERLKALEDAGKSDIEKLTSRAEVAEAAAEAATKRAQAVATSASVKIQAVDLKIIDPEVATTLVLPKLEYNDAGEPINVRTALEELVVEKPYLVGTGEPPKVTAPDPGSTSTGRNGQKPLTLEQVKRMKPEEINRRWDEVQVLLKSQGT
jgi:hypothetical protein